MKWNFFNEQFLTAAATIDEVLSDSYIPLSTGKSASDLAALRLSAWCKAACSGDWSLFSKRLQKDGLKITDVLTRFSNVRFNNSKILPDWFVDSKWIFESLVEKSNEDFSATINLYYDTVAFQELLVNVVFQAQQKVVSSTSVEFLSKEAFIGLCANLLTQLSEIAAPALYSDFSSYLKERVDVNSKSHELSNIHYLQFIATMQET